MTRLTYRSVAWLAIPLAAHLAASIWRQDSERGIAFAVFVPATIDGFPVTAAGFAALRGELFESARLRAEGGAL